MAKKYDIKVISYVHKGDKLVRFDSLTPQERKEAATQLKIIWLNSIFEGKVIFRAE